MADDKHKDVVDEPKAHGVLGKLYLRAAQKIGKAERTRLEPAFQESINKVVKYHVLVNKIVDTCELQVQPDIATLNSKIEHPKNENPWEMLGGWLTYLASNHFSGTESTVLDRYSQAAAKIATKERQSQIRSRVLIRKMRSYVSIESRKLNEDNLKMSQFLEAIDESRHVLKESKTVNEVKRRGEDYRKNINGFSKRANNLQCFIDEISSVVQLHQLEFIRLCSELVYLNRTKNQILLECRLRLGRKK